ncbi:MAG: T9SS type A sorting domain-containing protein [Ignavibacteriae bacterium]|nr:T9SS type A sorting domain-containing protein [Ignavibacteriota bacterium]
MIYFRIFFLVLFSITIQAQYDSLNYNGLWRKYLVHLPANSNDNEITPLPLIVAMHGGFGNALNIESQSQLSDLSDTSTIPFIVVYPEGVKSPLGITTWNAGECCGYASDNNIDDIGFISSLITLLENKYLIDTNMIYATGMSNGGMMSYRLAAKLSDKIAAIAPVASIMAFEETLAPTRPIPIIHFHSFLDTNVPIEGGIGSGFSNYNNLPLDSVLNVWSNLNNCEISNDTLYNETDEYLHKVWKQCSDETEIELYVTYDGGHSWPGGIRPRLEADLPSEKIDASHLIWEFFLAHPKNKITNVENTRTSNIDFNLFQNYPNPFNPETFIRYSIPAMYANFATTTNVTLKIYDVLGKQISTLVNIAKPSGSYEILFNASSLISGIYFYNLTIGNFTQTKKMIFLK